jgi:hypothetical protein
MPYPRDHFLRKLRRKRFDIFTKNVRYNIRSSKNSALFGEGISQLNIEREIPRAERPHKVLRVEDLAGGEDPSLLA